MQVTTGPDAPYIYDGRPFQRNQSSTVRMTQHHYHHLLMATRRSPYIWEEAITSEYSCSDLDAEEIYKTVADGIKENRIPASAQKEEVEDVLKRLNLLKEGGLTQAAIALYARREALKFVQCKIKMARFRGIDKLGEFLDNQQIQGNAFYLLERADAFLKIHLPIASIFQKDQFKRIDTPALPVLAVREALINAICHRDYADRSTDISLAIFDDRLEIWNSGQLPAKLTVNDLRATHQSLPRNPLIAGVFYARGYIEQWGTGTNKMIELCKIDKLPEPIFEERSGGLAIIFKFKAPISPSSQPKQAIHALTPRQEKIIAFLKEVKTATTNQVLTHLTAPSSTLMREASISRKTVFRDLLALQTIGLVNLIGQRRGTKWIWQDHDENVQ